MKKFSIPVNWEVWDKVEVEAETIEEAVQWLKNHIDEIPLGTEPEYIDGSYRIDDGENGEATVEDAVRYLKEYWNLSGGIDGEEIEENVPLETKEMFVIHDHMCDDTMIGIEDANHQLYEYHTDDDEVIALSNSDDEPAGKVLTGLMADKIREFALLKMKEQPERWKSPVDYRTRCADCVALVDIDGNWGCDECNKLCKEVMACPEGLANPILEPDTLLNQKLNRPQICQHTPDPDRLAEICNARDILCNFCKNNNCENCKVAILVNDAFCEFGENDNI